MNTTSFRRAIVPGVAALALALTGCGAGNEADTAGDTGAPSASVSGTIAGGGSSAQGAAQEAWIAAFQSANSGATITYDPVGSGGGRESFISGAYVFAGSDSYISDDEGELTKATEACGAAPIEVPDYISPIAVVFNLPGVDALNLSSDVIAQIFDGKITTWNDPAIADLNDGVDLPDTAITPVHRSDDSGTTANFTDYLSKTAPDSWTYPADDTWPTSSGEKGEGTSGLVSAVKGGEGTIGYADASQAGGLGIVSLQVGEEFVAPSEEAAAKAAELSAPVEGRDANDMAMDVDRTTTESGAYPLILVSYLLACPSYDDPETAALVKAYLSYIVSDEGQAAAEQAAGSAPLSAALAEKAQSIVAGIK